MLMIAMNVHGDSDSTAAFKAMNNDAPLTNPRGFDESREVVKATRSVEKTVDGDSAPAEKSVDDEVEADDDVALTFPQRLMEILENEENTDIISWLPHGRGFVIFRKKAFEQKILPKYFHKSSKYSSFTRKLNRWGFVRVTRGPEIGAYYHRNFQRGGHRLVQQMSCQSATKAVTMVKPALMSPNMSLRLESGALPMNNSASSRAANSSSDIIYSQAQIGAAVEQSPLGPSDLIYSPGAHFGVAAEQLAFHRQQQQQQHQQQQEQQLLQIQMQQRMNQQEMMRLAFAQQQHQLQLQQEQYQQQQDPSLLFLQRQQQLQQQDTYGQYLAGGNMRSLRNDITSVAFPRLDMSTNFASGSRSGGPGPAGSGGANSDFLGNIFHQQFGG